ncbi:MAG TPA: U32 family peptidase [Firmicutes bacterium]|nr:U32 family peptidase [Bacillota bacterium]
MKIPELLAPAGNMEKAKTAIAYGADAIYLSGQLYGMRAQAGNFDNEELVDVVRYARERNVKVYVTVNIIPHSQHLNGLPEYIAFLKDIGVDAIIVSDVGVISIAKRSAPELPLHLSTQANTVNWEAARFWSDFGIARIVLAREVTREEIQQIRSKVDTELELFVHGAMCMAYSGRCLLSAVMTGREANMGACTQSCRWKYTVMETKRPGEYFPIEETKEGTYIFNSKDLCLLEYLPEVIATGVDSLKIEGRMKSAYYVGTVVRAYRKALDDYAANPGGYQLDPELLSEVNKVSHRPYYPGFFFGERAGTYPASSAYVQSYDFVGTVESYDTQAGEAVVGVRNYFPAGSHVEIIQPRDKLLEVDAVEIIHDEDGVSLEAAHANYRVRIKTPPVKPMSMLRIARADLDGAVVQRESR